MDRYCKLKYRIWKRRQLTNQFFLPADQHLIQQTSHPQYPLPLPQFFIHLTSLLRSFSPSNSMRQPDGKMSARAPYKVSEVVVNTKNELCSELPTVDPTHRRSYRPSNVPTDELTYRRSYPASILPTVQHTYRYRRSYPASILPTVDSTHRRSYSPSNLSAVEPTYRRSYRPSNVPTDELTYRRSYPSSILPTVDPIGR